jgi:hypothetical protein
MLMNEIDAGSSNLGASLLQGFPFIGTNSAMNNQQPRRLRRTKGALPRLHSFNRAPIQPETP